RARVPAHRSQLGVGHHHALLEPVDDGARESLGGAQRLSRSQLRTRLDDNAAADELRVVAANAGALAERRQETATGHALPILGIPRICLRTAAARPSGRGAVSRATSAQPTT